MTTLFEWCKNNKPDDNLLWKESTIDQLVFVRDNLPMAYPPDDPKDFGIGAECRTEVVSVHTSKSCTLPVYEFDVRDARVQMRGNFYDWKLSVEAPRPVTLRLDGLRVTDPHTLINSVYCEGMTRVLGPYGDGNVRSFTVEIPYRREVLWAFVRELWMALG